MRLRPAALALSLLLAAAVGAGCSSSSSSDGGSTSTTKSPEDVLVSNAEAKTGLTSLRALALRASSEAKAGSSAVKATVDDAWTQWVKVEGRVKKNDTGAYLEFEDALSDMRTGAKEGINGKVASGATSVDALITSYLASFPG